MTDFDQIDQLLQDDTPVDTADNELYRQLINAAPQPAETFIQTLEDQLMRHKEVTRMRSLRRPMRGAAALIAICVLMVGAAFALDDLLRQSLGTDPGLRAVLDEGKGTELDLSAEIEQFTIEIQWGYVDTQRLTLGYVVRAHDDFDYTNFNVVDAVLTLPDGQAIPLHHAQVVHLIENNQGSGVLEARIADQHLSGELTGTLSLRLAYAHTAHRTAVPLPGPGLSDQTLEDWMLHTGPATFDLHLPIEPGYTLPLDLSATDAGITMHLREFQVAPSIGYAQVCYTPPDHPVEERWEWHILNATLAFNGEQLVEWAGGINVDGCTEIRLSGGLPLEPGTWTLTVHLIDGQRTIFPDLAEIEPTIEAVGGEVFPTENGVGGSTLPEGASETLGWSERITGEWAFTFDAPE